MPCVRCRYELRGAEALGRCPECGLAVATSLAACTDPGLRRLVALRHPARIAWLLIVVAAAQFLCVMLQLAAPMLAAATLLSGMTETFSHRVRFWGWAISAVATAIATGCSRLCVDRSEGPLRSELGRWHGMLTVGLGAWSLAAAGAAFAAFQAPFLPDVWRSALPWIGVATQLPGMAMTLGGFSVLLGVAGRRTGVLAEATSARQAASMVNAVAAMTLVASLAMYWLRDRRDADWMQFLHITLLAACGCLGGLLLLGSAYLLSNAWLVARGLFAPPPRLEEMLTPD